MPRLPQAPDSRHLRCPRIWSLTGHRRISPPKHPISSSTPWPTSAEVQLRLISGGTSHSRPRLAFHPYAQLIRVICTSTPVQPSTRLSAGFSLARHRSTGFGACLELDVYATHLRARFPTHATLDTPNHLPRVPLRGCHPL